ncbi:hypothetical protein HYX17_04550 [Candidatus Woesearchaeota archaeon]|nr:hypothetical protein [Candidatus Woesearchaeota archaeon]
MAEEKKDKKLVTVDDIVRNTYLGAGAKKINEDPRNARYAAGALEQYLAGASAEVREAVEPWIKGLPQAIDSNGGILPVLARNAYDNYHKNSEELFLEAKVSDILTSAKKLGYDGVIPEFTGEYKDKTFRQLAEEYKKIESKQKEKKELTEDEKKLAGTLQVLISLKERMYSHAITKMDDSFTSDQLKSLEEQLKPKDKK